MVSPALSAHKKMPDPGPETSLRWNPMLRKLKLLVVGKVIELKEQCFTKGRKLLEKEEDEERRQAK